MADQTAGLKSKVFSRELLEGGSKASDPLSNRATQDDTQECETLMNLVMQFRKVCRRWLSLVVLMNIVNFIAGLQPSPAVPTAGCAVQLSIRQFSTISDICMRARLLLCFDDIIFGSCEDFPS